ncbi:MAG: transcriptional activator domain-containing protein, partial [Acidimicrobiia bacterium]|nr:transcriptional activator domain-containing protein [Acidimicrobiia bacterium]
VTDAFDLLESDSVYSRAKAQLYSAYVFSQQGRFEDSRRAIEESRVAFRELGCGWEEAVGWVLAAHCAIAVGDPGGAATACAEASRQLERVGDPWLLVHTEAILGAVAQGEQRFADACDHLARAATQSEQSGFAATEAYHLANLGRAQQQHGALPAAADTLHRAMDVARGTGDLRVTALARMRLSRVLLAQGDRAGALTILQAAREWYHEAGGGDGTRLADCLFAAMGGSSDPGDATAQLESVLAEAREVGDTEVQVLALDALARTRASDGDGDGAVALLAAADALMPAALHHVTDADRLDARETRRLLGC